jgi:hypothetical protein
MTAAELDKILIKNQTAVSELMRAKGADYASKEDRLSNFKLQATRLGLTPYQVWGVYANKHWDAIMAFIRNNGQVESEPIESRIYDTIAYLNLMVGLIEDTKKSKKE